MGFEVGNYQFTGFIKAQIITGRLTLNDACHKVYFVFFAISRIYGGTTTGVDWKKRNIEGEEGFTILDFRFYGLFYEIGLHNVGGGALVLEFVCHVCHVGINMFVIKF